MVAETLLTDLEFMRVFNGQGASAARRHWVKEMGGITKTAHTIIKLKQGLVDPRHAEMTVGPLDLTGKSWSSLMLSDVRAMLNRWAETFYAKQFGKNERIQFYESLMGILEDGVSLEDALHTVARAFSDNGQKLHPVSLCLQGYRAIGKRWEIAEHFLRRLGSHDENSLIASGEDTGNLVQAFRDCVRIIEVRQAISKPVASATVFLRGVERHGGCCM